jgi:hypothetical protein
MLPTVHLNEHQQGKTALSAVQKCLQASTEEVPKQCSTPAHLLKLGEDVLHQLLLCCLNVRCRGL